eukprot:2643112-Prorocentrum_lima.AAC.1
MTSSLVGSEMCIRDRVHTRPCKMVCKELDTRGGEGVGCKEGGGVKAVSYTHLTLPTICSV